ncbi:MAG: tetratricopeptide repeat protein [Rikenellaceae bacterium]
MKKLLFSLIAMATVAASSAQTIQESYDKAVSAYGAKDFPTAAANFENVINKGMDDESATAMVTTAKTYLPKSYYMLGGASMKSSNYDDARANFAKAAEAAELYDDMATMNKAKTWVGKTYELQGGKAFNAKDYATALPVFEMGYKSDPRNAKMANWLGSCYCETGNFDKGMEVFRKVAAMGSNPKYKDEATLAQQNMMMYTNNKVADLQKSKNYDGVIALADGLLAKNPKNATAAKVRLQAFSDKKDYAKVFSSAEAAAALQTSADEKSNVYFILGAAYNAKEMKAEAIAAFKKVTSGSNAATAKSTIAELSK